MQDSSIKVWMVYSSEACTQSNPEPQTLHMYLSVYTYIYMHIYIYVYVYTLGFEVTREKKYGLLFHNGSLSVAGPEKSTKVWYSKAQYIYI